MVRTYIRVRSTPQTNCFPNRLLVSHVQLVVVYQLHAIRDANRWQVLAFVDNLSWALTDAKSAVTNSRSY